MDIVSFPVSDSFTGYCYLCMTATRDDDFLSWFADGVSPDGRTEYIPTDPFINPYESVVVGIGEPIVNPYFDRKVLASVLGITLKELNGILYGTHVVFTAPVDELGVKRGDVFEADSTSTWLKKMPCYFGATAIYYLLWQKDYFESFLPVTERTKKDKESYSVVEKWFDVSMVLDDLFIDELLILPDAVKEIKAIREGDYSPKSELISFYKPISTAKNFYDKACKIHMIRLQMVTHGNLQKAVDDLVDFLKRKNVTLRKNNE